MSQIRDSHWALLDIEPTSDRRAVKRAYAQKLKDCHPDDDPIAFQRLNEAYQYALETLEPGANEKTESQETEASLEDAPTTAPNNAAALEFRPQSAISQEFNRLLVDAEDHGWNRFFDSKELADFEYKAAIGPHFFGILIEMSKKERTLPMAPLHRKELGELFQWHEQELELCQRFDSNDVGRVLALLQVQERSNSGKRIPSSSDFSEKTNTRIDSQVFWYLGGLALLFLVFTILIGQG